MVLSTVKRDSGSLKKRSGTAERPDTRQTGQLQPSSVDYAKETVVPTWDSIVTIACESGSNYKTQEC